MSKLSRRQVQEPAAQAEVHPFAGLTRLQPHAAGADIGAHEIVVCVPGLADTQLVRTFGTYTADLESLAVWLKTHAVETIAMESTGVYWIPLFELLEQRGFRCCLINAAATKRMPGRKSDVADAQWIQTLHSYGLLANAFRPEAELIALRTLLRHRAQLVQHRSPHILHMQKALLQMNLQLSQVLSDVTGETGLKIIRAIVAGERDPHVLAALRNSRCHKDAAEIALALTGTWRAEHLFVLQQSLELFDFYTAQITACDAEVERTYTAIRPEWGGDQPELPPLDHKPRSHSKNHPQDVQVREHLYRIVGVDLVAVPGISASNAQTIVAEVGSSLERFPSAKHFCSWLSLAPHNDISGGKVLRSYRLKNHNRAGQAFIQAAAALIRSDTVFGACYRRLKSRIGPAQALIATAHKLARMVYKMLKDKVPYEHTTAQEEDERFREREIAYLRRRAAKLGLTLNESQESLVS
ncbi:MAG TPA: IS110 family transposase [Anaerolineae bacterium]|nr:IS110 family transposase [Anaerolineae bacterium]